MLDGLSGPASVGRWKGLGGPRVAERRGRDRLIGRGRSAGARAGGRDTVEPMSTPPAPGPCDGIRVLDFTTVVSGPACTQALGDLGADVLKLETLIGDMSRMSSGPYHEGLSGFFSQFNRNKRSLAIDLKSDAGRDVVRRLAAHCDVAVENFRPGVADRLGIGWEALHAANPRARLRRDQRLRARRPLRAAARVTTTSCRGSPA